MRTVGYTSRSGHADGTPPGSRHRRTFRLAGKNGEFEAIGGSASLPTIRVRSDGQLRHILRRGSSPAIPRCARSARTGGLTDAYDPAQTPDEVLSKIATALSEIATIQFGSKLVTPPTAVLAAMDRIEAITQRGVGWAVHRVTEI